MARVSIFAGDADTKIGDFNFQHLPRVGEEITVPWATDASGVRIFTVGEVLHLAEGTANDLFGDGPRTVLRYCTEIE